MAGDASYLAQRQGEGSLEMPGFSANIRVLAPWRCLDCDPRFGGIIRYVRALVRPIPRPH